MRIQIPRFIGFRLGENDKDITNEIVRRIGLGEDRTAIVKDLMRRGIMRETDLERMVKELYHAVKPDE